MDRQSEGAAGPLGDRFAEVLADCGAHAGGIYVRSGEDRLALTTLIGLPRRFISPWEHIDPSIAMPVSDAVRECRLIWLGGEEQIARTYPQFAVAFPYEYALGIVPIPDGPPGTRAVLGAFFALWRGPRRLGEAERRRLRRAADGLADALREGATGHRGGPPPGGAVPYEALRRLPEGLIALDAEGRPTWATERAARLLGVPLDRILRAGFRLPAWLDNPLFEDRYRAAVIGGRPTAFTAMRPPGNWLRLELFPGGGGMTVRVSPTGPRPGAATGGPDDAPAGLGSVYHLMHLASALTQAVGVRDVVDMVADHVLPAFGARGLLMTGVDRNRLRIVGSRGYDPAVLDALDDQPVDAGSPGARSLNQGVPLFVESFADLRKLSPEAVHTGGYQAWAFLPLMTSGRAIGSCVIAFPEPHRFTDDEKSVLTSLSGLTAQALERARLYDTEHQLAATLQEALLPHVLPRLPGVTVAARYLPGTAGLEIGGDFYDVVPLGPSHAAAVIGDVQGHNARAAALMGQVRTAIRAYTASGADPRRVLARTNQLLAELDVDLLTSCVYAHLDLPHRRVQIARAGHPQPLLRHDDGRVEVLEVPGGLPLGVQANEGYARLRVTLPERAVLALYTDGLVEVPGEDPDDALAQLADRLARTAGLPLEEAADALVAPAAAAPHMDDIAVLLLSFDDAEADGTGGGNSGGTGDRNDTDAGTGTGTGTGIGNGGEYRDHRDCD